MIHVRQCARDDDAYRSFAANAAAATVYHRPGWLDAVEDAFGWDCFRLLAERDGEPIGMLPICHVKSLLFGNFLVSAPFGNFGGMATTASEAYAPLLDAAVRIAADRGSRWIELRHIHAAPLDLPTQTRKVNQTLGLTRDMETVWKSLDPKVRNQVRKAEKEGLSFRFAGREGLDDFYEVFARNMRDLGTPVYSRRFFSVLWQHIGDSLRVAIVQRGHTLMAAMILMHFRDQVECPWASSLREFNPLCANMYMYWNVIRDAGERGLAAFDFGTSDHDSGPYKFKKQWGARERPLHRQYWLAPGQDVPHLNPSNPKHQWKIRAWRRLPLWLANALGPSIARQLP